ncbi:MAG: tRNA (uridine(34)/cytosine(34)/5-carboxymethylaminomethyluridine(34)-2'-O)-methyltransferase TrmL [Legionellales bacterium]|nr:MAG: tRNA (uridine(34)/cytosine(34)/5-carboxymethylaminomethyluridine(34)-2'-O)-methyltransferase TrmL [Legionellales bacterium]
MFHIILYQPQIPQNTGGILRLCANTGTKLHIIEPMGFQLSDKQLKRSGLDYIANAVLQRYEDLESCLSSIKANNVYLCSTKAATVYSDAQFCENDALIFGSETNGLPLEVMQVYPEDRKITIPMCTEHGRSLNLAMACGIVIYEAWRQLSFK